jgi:hypothetical protein
MDFIRAAQELWFEWTGEGFNSSGYKSVVYFTYDHVDMNNSICLGGLASSLQRDGLVDSLSDGRNAIEKSSVFYHGFAGAVDESPELTICNEHGETFYGDSVETTSNITLVEVYGLGQ